MKRPKPSEPCATPACFWRRAKDLPFCAGCWRIATEGERAMVLTAAMAPFWPRIRGITGWEEGTFYCDDFDFQPVTQWRDYPPQLRCGGLTPGTVLHEWEARSTLAAVAGAVALRRQRIRLGMEEPE